MSCDSVESLTKDLKDILVKTKKELQNKDAYIKKQSTINDLTRKEYQKLYEYYSDLEKKMSQYESYARTQRIEMRRKELNDNEKQKKTQELRQVNDLALLNEIKKLKKLNMMNDLQHKTKKKQKT